MNIIVTAETMCAVFTGISLAVQIGEHDTEKSARLLKINSWVILFWLLTDITSYCTNLSYLPTLLTFSLGSLDLLVFCLYCEEYIGKKAALSSRIFLFPKLLCLLCILGSVTSFLRGKVVVYENGIVTGIYGNPIYVQAMQYIAMLFLLVIALTKRKKIGLRNVVLIGFLDLAPMIAALMYIQTGNDFTVVISAVSVMAIVMFIQDEQRRTNLKEHAENEILVENNARIFALEDNFESLYEVELESGRYSSYVKGDFYQKTVIDKLVEPGDYFEDLRANIEAAIYPEDRDGLYRTLTRDAIRRELADSEHFDYYYRINTENSPIWFKMRIVYKDAEKKSVIIGVFNAAEEMAAKLEDEERLHAKELELKHSEFRASALAYLAENEGDIASFMNFFSEKLRELVGCDQVIYRDAKGNMFVNNARELGVEYRVPINICKSCGHYDIFAPIYASGVVEMPDTGVGVDGVPVSEGCPVKSSLTRIVTLDGEANGYLTIHYLLGHHTFSDYERQTLEEFTNLLSVSLSRYAARTENAQLAKELELKQQIEAQNAELEKNMQMIGGLASGYNALYYINIRENSFHIYALDEEKYPGSRSIFEGENPDFYKIVGGYGLSERVHPDDRYLFKDFGPEWIREKLTGRKKYSMRFRAATQTGYRWDEMELTKYEDLGEPANAVAVGFTDRDADIRREQEYQQQLEIAREEADHANRSKSNFLFNMSHDIRTPMNAIRGFTTMAKKNVDDKEKVTGYLDKIDISGQQLLTLINQVLEMARIESGRIEFEEKPINVRGEFNSMVTVLSEQAKATGLKFIYRLGNIEHNNVLADEARMSSITLNIVGNAMKYTPEGGTVEYELKEIPGRKTGYASFVFSVSDTGIGMSKEYLKELYEPFSREKNSTVSKIQGTGLGLPIVKNIIDLMGGNIEVQSELGKGTRFDITVDLKIDENAGCASEETDTFDAVSFKGRRVLLVEDNEMNREIARDILEEQGIIVEDADDGDVAVEMVRAAVDRGEYHYYDFILMDVQMPRMNGYEATKAIRAIPGPADVHIPIIAMTANAFEEDRQNALAAGMDEHLAKPIDVSKAFRTIARFL